MNQTLITRINFIKNAFDKQFSTELLKFVPKHNPVLTSDVKKLEEFVDNSKNILIVTGAGISTESGIPDYRSEGVGLYASSNHKPVQYQDFLKSASIRQRYWARNFVGWNRFSQCQPNAVHESVKNLELVHKKVTQVVTQNVDSLHTKAGSKNVVELHGTAFRVICLDCEASFSRFYIQEKLLELNPEFKETTNTIRPDGDVQIPLDLIKDFKTPFCESCGGVLKPDIVFFGDNVPKLRVDLVRNGVSACDGVLVLGSSLSVFSGFRIILQAVEEDKDVVIVNIGPTRADHLVKFRVAAKCGDVLPKIC